MPDTPKIEDVTLVARLDAATQEVGPEEIFKALEAWGKVADLLPEEEIPTLNLTFANSAHV